MAAIDEQRLDGDVLSFGCVHCPLLEQCGGYTRVAGAWSCMDRCGTQCDRVKCRRVCLKRGSAFVGDLAEIGGFGFGDVPRLGGDSALLDLPRYVPMVQHGRVHKRPLRTPWAAIPLKEVFRIRQGGYTAIAGTPTELRRICGLAPTTRVLFVGTGRDPVIERYWQWRRLHDAPKQLAELGIEAAVVPNFSFCLDDPRPQHLANRKRSLICAREMASAGLNPVPYLQALTPADWDYWRRFLKQHVEVTFVAKEFQTGLARRERGLKAIRELRHLESSVGRPLHIVAIGGAQYARDLAARFKAWTIVDSIPFMKAIKRRAAHPTATRIHWRPALGEDPGVLLDHNVLAYEEWLSEVVSH